MEQKESTKLRRVESRINRHLFLICAMVTVLVMIFFSLEFFTRGFFKPAKIELFYLGVLVIYSIHKELLRWLGKRKIERQGEYFVYSWIILTSVLYVVNFLANGYFSYSVSGKELAVLSNMSILTVEVLAIFIFTRALKIVKATL